jgi:Bacterial regulatory protein, Fis family/Sigma-54 interaction domain/PAS fold
MPRTSATGSLTTLLDASIRPVYVVDAVRRIIYCNAALAEWLELEPGRIIGRTVEYHSEAANKTTAGGDLTPLTDLCPPPRALAGEPCQGTISAMARDGRLAHRQADFVPLGAIHSSAKSPKIGDSKAITQGGVLVLLSAEDLSPQEIASDLSGDPSADDLHRTIRQFRRGQAALYAIHSLLGESSAMRKVRAQVAAAAASGVNVLVSGRPGGGRGHIARAIHYHAGGEAASKLIPLRCELVSDELLRRALDSLRVASSNPQHRPTLLLEHLECLAQSHQLQLLAVLRQNATSARIIATYSSNIPPANADESRRTADSRAATDLAGGAPTRHAANPAAGSLTAGTLDPALVDALSTIAIDVPPLVDRLEDLPLLAQYFLEACNAQGGKQVGSISAETLDLLFLHNWPGELDELREVIAAAHRSCISPEIIPANLPAVVHHASRVAARTRRQPVRIVLDELLAAIEKEALERALSQAGGNKTEAAELLGMTRTRLYRRLVQLGLVSEAPPDSDAEQPEFVEQDPGDHAP